MAKEKPSAAIHWHPAFFEAKEALIYSIENKSVLL
jgi:hypothetical protein